MSTPTSKKVIQLPTFVINSTTTLNCTEFTKLVSSHKTHVATSITPSNTTTRYTTSLMSTVVPSSEIKEVLTSTLSLCLVFYSTIVTGSLYTKNITISSQTALLSSLFLKSINVTGIMNSSTTGVNSSYVTIVKSYNASSQTTFTQMQTNTMQIQYTLSKTILQPSLSTMQPNVSSLKSNVSSIQSTASSSSLFLQKSSVYASLFSTNLTKAILPTSVIMKTIKTSPLQTTQLKKVTSIVTVQSIYSTISPSLSVVLSTSVAPQTTPNPINNDVEVTLVNVDIAIDVATLAFKVDLEQKLVATYVSLKSKRKRRSVTNGNTTATITKTTRNDLEVNVQFNVKENNASVPAQTTADTFNLLSVTGLQNRIGYTVTGPVQTVASATQVPFKEGDLLGIVLVDDPKRNLSESTQQQGFQNKIAKFYKDQRSITDAVTAKITFVKHELGSVVYVEFYLIVKNVVQNATYTAQFFQTHTTADITNVLNMQVLFVPYAANTIAPINHDQLVKMTIETLIIDVTSKAFRIGIASKITEIYTTSKNKKRKRRATGSTITQISSYIILPSNAKQAEIVFVIINGGHVLNAQSTVAALNNVSLISMQAILGAKVVSKPEPWKLSVSAASTDPPYWIIGVIIGSVVLIILICVCIVWRWRSGAPVKTKLASGDEIQMVEKTSKDTPPTLVHQDETTINKESLSVPLFSGNNNNVPEQRTSTRRKIKPQRIQRTGYGRQNHQYEPSEEEEDEEEEESEKEEDEEEEITTRKPPTPAPRTKPNINRRLEYERKQKATPQSSVKPPPRKPLGLVGTSLENDEELKPMHNLTFSAGHVPSFGRMTETKELAPNPPVRFRTNVNQLEHMDAYTQPAGPLPILDLKQTSLMAAPYIQKVDPDLQHKSEIERIRNKQRQRDQMFTARSSIEPRSPVSPSSLKRSWQREQDQIDLILDPCNADPFLTSRKGRARRRLRRKNKIYMAPTVMQPTKRENVSLRNIKMLNSPIVNKVSRDGDNLEAHDSETESDISMNETRCRIHTLLDDTFSALKKYQNNLLKDESPEKFKKTDNHDSSPPRRFAGMVPYLPEPAPAHGRANTTPPGNSKRRIVQNPYAVPYNPYTPTQPFTEPMLTWDPAERQRYLSQQHGFPVYGQVPSSVSLPYGMPGQNVYITPVQQRADGLGGMVWSPYGAAGVTNPGYNTIQVPNIPAGDYLPRAPDVNPPHSRVLDMNDVGSLKKKGTQPLIRAIKEELLKLSHNANGRTRIQELNNTTVT